VFEGNDIVLTAKQRRYLKGLAHELSPFVHIGRNGVTPAVVAETKRSLEAHELIKVRIDSDEPKGRRALAETLAAECDAHLAGTVGKIAILYRERGEKPAIKLPR